MVDWPEANGESVFGSERDVIPLTFEGLRRAPMVLSVLRGVSIDEPPETYLRPLPEPILPAAVATTRKEKKRVRRDSADLVQKP